MAETRDPDSEHSPYMRLPWPAVAVGVFLVLAGVLGLGVYANQNLRGQPSGRIPPTATAAAATAATPTPAAAVLIQSTSLVMQIATRQPTKVPSETLSPLTLNPSLIEEVGRAYERYWQVRAEAVLVLSDTRLREVMDGDHLTSVEQLIQELRAEGRAIESSVEHSYTVVEATKDYATVTDSYISNSVYVDAVSRVALSQPTADRLSELYTLSHASGSWKVVSLVNLE
jgi:hypothetical protein